MQERSFDFGFILKDAWKDKSLVERRGQHFPEWLADENVRWDLDGTVK